MAWVLVRDRFRGKSLVDAVLDLPFALPTIVAGLTLLALYGPSSPFGDRHRLHEDGDPGRVPVRDPAVRRPRGPAGAARARHGNGGGGRLARRGLVRGLPADHLPEPVPGDPLRRRALVRPRRGGVRRGRPDLREPAVQDRGLGRLHLRPAPVGQRHRCGGRLGAAPADLARRPARESARFAAGRRGTTMSRYAPAARRARLPRRAPVVPCRADLLPGVRARNRPRLGRGHDSTGAACAGADALDRGHRGAGQHRLRDHPRADARPHAPARAAGS